MKLAPLLLAAPAVLTMVAADARASGGPNRRVLDRWRFARQDESSAAASTPAANTSREVASSTTPTSAPAETTSSTPAQPTSTSSPTSQQQQQPTSTSTPVSSRASPTSATSNQQQQSASTPSSAAVPSSPTSQSTPQVPTTTEISLSTPPPTTAAVSTTDQHGNVVTSYIIFTQAPSSVAITPTSTGKSTDDKEGGVNKSTVIGLAVTGSIAGLLIILLIVWKLTNKRFSDLEDTDDDAIKWPELHKDSAAMTPIPARPSTRAAGTETDTLGTDFDRQSAAHSAADLTYQPYSDDPGYGARPGYYDPYGGAPGAAKLYPSPPGSHDGDHKNWGGPADPQYYDAPRGPSPGPNAIARGMSPGPGIAYDARVASPAPPNMAYADPVGRTGSPGPAVGGYGYGGGYAQPDPYGGRSSPGPNMAYGQPEMDPYGRRSPGPGMAYNGPGRVASPGPGAYR